MTESSGRLTRALAVLAAAGHDLDAQELLDVLWLAAERPTPAGLLPLAHAVQPPEPETAEEPTDPAGRGRPARRRPAPKDSTGRIAARLHAAAARPQPADTGRDADTRTGSAFERQRTPPALPLRIPGEKAISDQLATQRALRPLRRQRHSPVLREIDEAATATALAETGLIDAVTRPAQERWLDLVLLLDDGLSMLLWHRMASDIKALLIRLGAFRAIAVHGLDTRLPGQPRLRARPFSPQARAIPTTAPLDRSGSTLVLVVSDGTGAAWNSGAMHALLAGWAAAGPTAIVHALPPELWEASGIRASSWQVTTRRSGGANTAWTIADPVLPPKLAPFTGLPVPVLEPLPAALRRFAQVVASPGTTLELPLLYRPRQHEVTVGAVRRGDLQQFKDSASPEAYRLASHLAAYSPVSVPVMRLVLGAVPWPARVSHLAEVFLGGLMHSVPPASVGPAPPLPQHRAFDFTGPDRTALLDAVPTSELLTTSRIIGRRLEQLAGQSPDFPVWLIHHRGQETLPSEYRAFTSVERRVLARFGLTGSARRPPRPPTVLRQGVAAQPEPVRWEPLTDDDPRHLGRWRLLGRQPGPVVVRYLARSSDDDRTLAEIRTVRPGLPLSDARRLGIEAVALRRLAGKHAPTLLETAPGDPPPWTAVRATDSESSVSRLDDLVQRSTDGSSVAMDILSSIALCAQLANILKHCHVKGVVPGHLGLGSFVLVDRTVLCVSLTDCAIDDVYEGPGAPPTAADNMHDLGIMMRAISSTSRGIGHLWRGDTWQPLRDLTDQCTHEEPARRPSAGEAAAILTRYATLAAGTEGTRPDDEEAAPAGPELETAARVRVAPRRGVPAEVLRPLTRSHRITVLGAHQGCGRATTSVVLGATLATLRDQRVLAMDSAPNHGDLHEHLPLHKLSGPRAMSSLPLDASYEDLRRFTSGTASPLEILAHGRVTAVDVRDYREEYRRLSSLTGRHYPIVIGDWASASPDSADAILELTDTLIVCCTSAPESVEAAERLLQRVGDAGHGGLTSRGIAVVVRLGSNLPSRIPASALNRVRTVRHIPFDTGISVLHDSDPSRLRSRTRSAFVRLAAAVAEDFPEAVAQEAENDE